MKGLFKKYFGLTGAGVNLLKVLENLPLVNVNTFQKILEGINSKSRIFFIGNGGSFDNARLMAELCRNAEINAGVPGHIDDYLNVAIESGYSSIYKDALQKENLQKDDIVIALSGSGNSLNILEGLKLAKLASAKIFCIGGRDGGKMRLLCGENNSIIAKSECMECIEDIQLCVMHIVLESLHSTISTQEILKNFIKSMKLFLSEKNMTSFVKLGAGILSSVKHNRFLFVLGIGYGANHFRADMMRGASNMLPVRGVSAPEFFSLNSAQATANDDGLDFILVDGLVKYNPSMQDFALICELEGRSQIYKHCKESLDYFQTPYITIGNKKDIDISMFRKPEFIVSMLGHACSNVIRETIISEFTIKELSLDIKFASGQKKLGLKETLDLELELKNKKILSKDEIIIFYNGKLYSVRGNISKQKRCFF